MNEFLIFQRMISILNICRECYLKRKKKVIIEGYRVIGSFHFFLFIFFYDDDQIWKRMNMRTLLK